MSVYQTFSFWSAILVLKILAMAGFTGRYRFQKKIFANPGDTDFIKGSTVNYEDPDIERVRRCHLNDLENILPWFLCTYVYLGTGPDPFSAGILIRIFVLARICHTLAYAVYPQQPLRAISYFVGVIITLYQAFATLVAFISYV